MPTNESQNFTHTFPITPELQFFVAEGHIKQILHDHKDLHDVIFYIPKEWYWMKYGLGWSHLGIPKDWHRRIWEGYNETHVRIRYTKE